MMKISIRPKILDIAIFLLSVIAVVFISISVYATQGNTLYVHISGATGEWIESLDKDQELQIPGPLGITYVHIENHSVRIEDSPCDNKLCIAMGAISQANQWVACLPNKVFVRIESGAQKDEIDAAAF
ncbi:MAG: NusG domain II-containing protein [Spirochaetia bacterium]|nr:NusG domain II-containing protein [Spirochaetia bacterium]